MINRVVQVFIILNELFIRKEMQKVVFVIYTIILNETNVV